MGARAQESQLLPLSLHVLSPLMPYHPSFFPPHTLAADTRPQFTCPKVR